jgi:hypothetical protein
MKNDQNDEKDHQHLGCCCWLLFSKSGNETVNEAHIKPKSPDCLSSQDWILYRDDTPVHIATSVRLVARYRPGKLFSPTGGKVGAGRPFPVPEELQD